MSDDQNGKFKIDFSSINLDVLNIDSLNTTYLDNLNSNLNSILESSKNNIGYHLHDRINLLDIDTETNVLDMKNMDFNPEFCKLIQSDDECISIFGKFNEISYELIDHIEFIFKDNNTRGLIIGSAYNTLYKALFYKVKHDLNILLASDKRCLLRLSFMYLIYYEKQIVNQDLDFFAKMKNNEEDLSSLKAECVNLDLSYESIKKGIDELYNIYTKFGERNASMYNEIRRLYINKLEELFYRLYRISKRYAINNPDEKWNVIKERKIIEIKHKKK